MKIINYPDGSSYAKVDGVENEFVFKINSYNDLWHLNQIVDALNNVGIKPTIIIPNLIDAQADKRFNENESSGLKLVAKFLNNKDANFKIFHPHNPELTEGLIDNLSIIDNSEFIKAVLCKLSEVKVSSIKWGEDLSKNLILMSSDAGGFKPLVKLCNKIDWRGETYSAVKARSWDKINEKSIFTQEIHREDFKGKDILIIDDLCIYGGTFKGLSKLLKERNCGKLFLAVSHITVQNLGEDPITNYFDMVFTTNSKYDNYIVNEGLEKFKIMKLF